MTLGDDASLDDAPEACGDRGQDLTTPGRRATQWGSALVKTITDASARREVRIVKYRDGSYGFEEWHFSEHPDELCWIPSHQRLRTITDTADAAEREARARVDWLIEPSVGDWCQAHGLMGASE